MFGQKPPEIKFAEVSLIDRLNHGVEGVSGINPISATSLLAISALWPIVIGVRTLAMMITVVAGGFSFSQLTVPLMLAIVVSIVIDVAIFIPSLSARARQFAGVRFPSMLATVVCLSSTAYAFALLSIAHGLGSVGELSGMIALLVALLPSLAVLVPHRMLMFLASMSTAMGALGACGDLRIVLGAMVFLPAMLLVALIRSKEDHEAEAKVDEQKLNNERARCLLSDYEKSGRGWFWETDRHGRIVYISREAISTIEADPDTIIGQPLSAVICSPGVEGGGSERTFNFHFSARTAFNDLAVHVAQSKEERAWSLSGGPFYSEFGQFVGFRGHGTDLTEVKRSHEAVTQLARYDNLTGLANRLYIKELFEKALIGHRGEPSPCSLFLLDLDRFKQVNDTLGHPIGDALLKQVSERLKRTIGDSGEVGRLGATSSRWCCPASSARSGCPTSPVR